MIAGCMLLLAIMAPSMDPFADRLDEQAYLEALARLQLTDVMDVYLSSRELDDPLVAAGLQVTSLGTAMRDPQVDMATRRELLGRRLEVRARVFDGEPMSPDQEATWRIEQAEDHLLVGLGLEYTGLAALYGRSTPEGVVVVRDHVEAARHTLSRAEIAVEKAVWELEKTPASKRTAVQRNQLVELRETFRDQRLPLLRGMALVYAGVLEVDAQKQQALMDEAINALGDLHEQLDGAARVKASWLGGLAEAYSGNYEAAEELFRDAATDDAASRSDLLAARLGGVVNRSIAGGPERGLRGIESLSRRYAQPGDWPERILIADISAKLHQEAAGTSNRLQHEAAAVEAWLEVGRGFEAEGVDPTLVEVFLEERLLNLPVGVGSSDHLPGELVLMQLRKSPETSGLEGLLRREDLSDQTRVRTMLLLSEQLEAGGRVSEAADLLLEAASIGGSVKEGALASERAARLSMRLLEATAPDPETISRARSALAMLCERYPELPGVDDWRLAAARLSRQDDDLVAARLFLESITPGVDTRLIAIVELADVLRLQAQAAGDPEPALAAMRQLQLEQGGARSDEIGLAIASLFLDAGRSSDASGELEVIAREELDAPMQGRYDELMLRSAQGDAGSLVKAAAAVSQRGTSDGGSALLTALRTALERLDAAARVDGSAPDVATLRRELLPLAEALEQWLRSKDMDDAVAWSLVADARRRCGDSSAALVIYDRLLPGNSNAGSILAGRAEALVAAGGPEQLAEAMGLYRRLVSAGMDSNARRWWIAQLRMLEILDMVDQNTDRIAPRIRRLQQQDPSLGGVDTRRAFERLLVKYQ